MTPTIGLQLIAIDSLVQSVMEYVRKIWTIDKELLKLEREFNQVLDIVIRCKQSKVPDAVCETGQYRVFLGSQIKTMLFLLQNDQQE